MNTGTRLGMRSVQATLIKQDLIISNIVKSKEFSLSPPKFPGTTQLEVATVTILMKER